MLIPVGHDSHLFLMQDQCVLCLTLSLARSKAGVVPGSTVWVGQKHPKSSQNATIHFTRVVLGSYSHSGAM